MQEAAHADKREIQQPHSLRCYLHHQKGRKDVKELWHFNTGITKNNVFPVVGFFFPTKERFVEPKTLAPYKYFDPL